MVTAAQTAKAPFIRIADRYALVLLPVTLALAGAAWWWSGDPIRGLAVLVASTPCPLILAAPVAFIAGVSRAARLGILIKGGGPLEALARTHTVIFDKTGTLTVGGARLVAVETAPGEHVEEVLRLAASLEQASHHVVASAIVAAAVTRGLSLTPPSEVRESLGAGLEGRIGGQWVKAGSHQLVWGGPPEAWATRALRRASWRSALSVFVSADGRVIGAILLADELRRETPFAVQSLRAAGVRRIMMVTGDRAEAAETIGAALDIDAVLADREPADKVDAVVRATAASDGHGWRRDQRRSRIGRRHCRHRDGRARRERLVGSRRLIILVDRLDRVADAVDIARRARAIAVQSIVAGMSLSGLAMLAAAAGWLTPVAGALTQEAIDVAVILNALRALRPPWRPGHGTMPAAAAQELQREHQSVNATLDRLREIADGLDSAAPETAVALIREANALVGHDIIEHERADESRAIHASSNI